MINRRAVLSDYIDAMEREPFAYGRHDCLLFVAGAVHAVTGIDHAAEQRGQYRSLAAAKRLIGQPLDFVASRFPEIDVPQAKDGDIAALKQGREWAFGIFVGAHVYAVTKGGLGILPRSEAVKAFEV
jgi:hypothetical protein